MANTTTIDAKTGKKMSAKTGQAEVVRSYGPYGQGGVHGVTSPCPGTARSRTGSRPSSAASRSTAPVEETLTVQDTMHIAGVEANGQGEVWCGGAAAPYKKGGLLLVCPR